MINGLTRKELVKATGVPHYTIAYLTQLDRLPLVYKAVKKGDTNLYHPNAIRIVKDWLSRREIR